MNLSCLNHIPNGMAIWITTKNLKTKRRFAMEPLWHRQRRNKQIALLARKNRWYRYEEMKNNLSRVLGKSSA
jgi:hypothetical protein